MKFAFRFLAGLLAIFLLLISLALALVAAILKLPGNLVDLIGKLVFKVGNKIAKWLIMTKVQETLKKVVNELAEKQKAKEEETK